MVRYGLVVLVLDLLVRHTKVRGDAAPVAAPAELVPTDELSGEEAGLLEQIVESLPHMIFLKDAKELRFVRFNRAGETLLGYDRAELLGKNDYDFFPKEEAEFFIQKDREVLAGGAVVDIAQEPIHTRHQGEV